MPEVILTTVEQFCKKHSGYEIFLVGTVDTSYSIKIQNTDVTVLSKLPKKEYIDLLASCDVVIALIYSAHPGVIAFQAAASGIPTVTNEFDNRKKDYFLKLLPRK
nr:glycosyltransferase [Yersinia enterocolitica]